MKYVKDNYIWKEIQLYPGDTVSKYGRIIDVDDLGWTIKITKLSRQYDYNVGDIIFISHSKSFTFKFM